MEFKVSETLQFGNKLIVIYAYGTNDTNRPIRNLYAYDSDGERLWIAENRIPNDPFTGFVGNGKSIQAATWDCYSCTIDPETGKILESRFVK